MRGVSTIFSLLFLTGCRQRDPDESYTIPEIKEGTQITESFYNFTDTLCVEGALVMCTSCSSGMSISKMIKTGDGSITMQGAPELNHLDTNFNPRFFSCLYSSDGKCNPLIENEEWQDYDADHQVGNGYALIQESSYMFCQSGFGLLYITKNGQKDTIVEKTIALSLNEKLSRWLFTMEAPYTVKFDNDDGIISPHNLGDGRITIGAGHTIKTENDANKYGFGSFWGNDFRLGNLSFDDVASLITQQQNIYGAGLENPAILTVKDSKLLLLNDLEEYRQYAQDAAKKKNENFSSNEMDALTSLFYGGTIPTDPQSLSWHFLEKDKQSALEIIRWAQDGGVYNEFPGTFRRRLMEYNIFFNNDYSFYDVKDLEILKEKVGY